MHSNGYSSKNGFGNGVNSNTNSIVNSNSNTNSNSTSDSSRNFYDQEKDDPTQVDGVLSEELMRLSVKDRINFQEEIHGVRCLAPDETPELIKESLKLLQWELEHKIPVHEKQAYLTSQHPPLNLTTNKTKKNSRTRLDDPNFTYVNTDDFRLRFLRYELFDAHKAALRICRFLQLALESFGDFALRRPIRLSDFSKHEMKHIRKGKYQFLPYRDRGGVAGRRVLVIFPDEEWEAMQANLRTKIMMYVTWVAGNDVDVQREGIIYLVWFDKTFKVTERPGWAKDHQVISVRAAAIHCLSPDTPLFRFRRSVMTMRIGRHNRTRLNALLGESVELRYKINAFGIDSEQIPITYSGKIKVVYFKQWLKVRHLIEQAEAANMQKSPNDKNENENESGKMTTGHNIIESPYLSDIIFRKGASLVSHAGNTTLRTLIVAKARKDFMLSNLRPPPRSNSTVAASPKKTGRFVEEIIQELRAIGQERVTKQKGKPCRFLVWSEEGWWEELFQEHEIHTRVEYIARGIRNTVVKNYKKCSNFAAANSISSTAKPTTTSSAAAAAAAAATPLKAAKPSTTSISSSSDDESMNAVVSRMGTPTNEHSRLALMSPIIQFQKGGTSMFRSLDHSSNTEMRKKRKLVSTSGEEDTANDSNVMCGDAECFGMKFNST